MNAREGLEMLQGINHDGCICDLPLSEHAVFWRAQRTVTSFTPISQTTTLSLTDFCLSLINAFQLRQWPLLAATLYFSFFCIKQELARVRIPPPLE